MAGPPTSYGEWTAEQEPVSTPNVEEVKILVLKPSFKSRKGKELNPKFFDAEEHEAFLEADTKQWQQYLDLGAVEVIPPEKAKDIPKNKILPIASRFVRTNKNKDATKKELTAASRLVVPGRLQDTPSQEDGGDRTDAPTVPQLGLHLGLSIAASKRWPAGVFDVSAAFLRGDEMPEEVYVLPSPSRRFSRCCTRIPHQGEERHLRSASGTQKLVQEGQEDHRASWTEGAWSTSWNLRLHGRQHPARHLALARR